MRATPEMLARWRKYCALYVHDLGHGQTVDDVTSGACAWMIAHKVDIPREAYHVGMNDAHIATALRRIFPNATFTGKER